MINKLFPLCLAAGLGLVFGWMGACGDPNPRGVIVVGGSGGLGAGTGGTGTSTTGSGGADVGSGGAPAGTGGASTGGSVGSGGDGASGGVATGGVAMPTGGASSLGGAQAAGAAGGGAGQAGLGGAPGMPSVIDDFEDGDGRIAMSAGRQGPWHSFNDSNGGNQTPPLNGTFAPEKGGANGSSYAAHTKGSGYQFGGIGFDLSNATNMPGAMECQAYDASAYKGIRFWAKGNGNLRVEFPQKTFVPTANGGSCTGTCWNVYGSRSAQGMLSATEWKQLTIPFAGLQRDDGSMMPAFAPSQLMGIAFKSEGSTFDFWIDDVEFY